MDANQLRIELIERIRRLPPEGLARAAQAICGVEGRPVEPRSITTPNDHWPHAPRHEITENGTYMVTTGTQGKEHLFHTAERLSALQTALLSTAAKFEWTLEAWAIFSNHYHFVGYTFNSPTRLDEFLGELHATTARGLNDEDRASGRKVWHNYWDTQLTYEKSYLARLNYTHQNAAKHGLVPVANQYPWCSAAWFERTARPAQVKTIYGFKVDKLKILDEFEPLQIAIQI